VYGTVRLEEIERQVRERADELGVSVEWTQTNHEGALVDQVQALPNTADGAIVNAAALTHTSIGLRDAFLAVRVPFVEVHLSNIFAREPERRQSVLADLAVGIVAGFGAQGYVLALEALTSYLRDRVA
jgi:3-dehydroquinate dehydratase II